MDNEMINKLASILMKHNPQTKIGAAIVVVELLTAMREPTDEILGAIHGCLPDIPDRHASIVAKDKWQTAIDAIIGD